MSWMSSEMGTPGGSPTSAMPFSGPPLSCVTSLPRRCTGFFRYSATPNCTAPRSPKLKRGDAGGSRPPPQLWRLVGRVRLGAARLWGRLLGMRERPMHLFMCVALCVSFVVVMWWLLMWCRRRHPLSEEQLARLLGPLSKPWSVLVQHEGAADRLSKVILVKEWLARCSSRGTPVTECKEPLLLSPHMLPSWTLHVVEEGCADCTDQQTYASAVEGVVLQARHAVFATSAAPLGRVGPMLLAMASVTDDVDVRAELPQWEWLRHVHGSGFPAVGGAAGGSAPPRAPYLAVMGIPSTDQRPRAALREAQRKTWLAYQEVARRDNHFTGALLALYVFAAAEPDPILDPSADSAESLHSGTSAASPGRARLRVLLPTTAEYKAATQALLARAMQADGVDAVAGEGFAQRRMELRRGWSIAAVDGSPCAEVASSWTAGGAKTSALSYLSGALSLPVTPAFTSPAEYICHASSALWQEALTHRNVLWIDMMTDRRPTTKKKLGEPTKWGLPVEVGMSQKLILWLAYAYHAFKDVPFIIKGDDDAYVKVPQFLSDVRYVMGGMQGRPPPPSSRRGAASGQGNLTETLGRLSAEELAKSASLAEDTECVYWGSLRHHLHTQFSAGMTFMLHRRVVQALLEPKVGTLRLDVLRLAADDFSAKRTLAYRRIMFHHEDILIGLQIYRALERVKALCRTGRLWYVKEWYARFHDMHVGRTHNVTWSTVVAHRCRPADAYYLHFYFQEEHRIAAAVSASRLATEEEHEAAAVKRASQWLEGNLQDPHMMAMNWSGLPDVQWVQGTSRRPSFTLAEGDGVAVYDNRYEYWRHEATNIHDGYRSLPQW
ncbi:phosphoglycan_beta_1_-3_galactosyltransferase (plasmid) [Leishmania braziliensis MHOM/BR/75/M2904]|uniref:Phosphoglycan_beta_1_-3_galactosyltransferase n=1 Tax=Leishmania braziliensis MHOM/BR/75/M2904 TaxID=420245 RepID=A0A3P3YWP2_LEIBR|nr:phosphoglycan_beta_1_-3_galactosyltransferase [Leishmania braziliensis MHOM/BR/75/M2904]